MEKNIVLAKAENKVKLLRILRTITENCQFSFSFLFFFFSLFPFFFFFLSIDKTQSDAIIQDTQLGLHTVSA